MTGGVAETPNILWQTVVLYSELNLLVPLETLLYLYDPDKKGIFAVTTQVLVPMLRVTATYAGAMCIIYLSLSHVASLVMVALAAGAYALEINWTDRRSFRAAGASVGLYIAASVLPINFVLNLVADTSTPLARGIAVGQTLARGGAILIIFSVLTITTFCDDCYARAWSCYSHPYSTNGSGMVNYTRSLCPLYTHEYVNNWACVNSHNPVCNTHEMPKGWYVKPEIFHHSVVLLGLLYGYHVVNVLISLPFSIV